MFASRPRSFRLLLTAVAASAVCVSVASAQPVRSRPGFPATQPGARAMPQINTSPYANGSIERALLLQELSIARRNNPYGFYPIYSNPWVVNPVYPPVFAPPVVVNPVFAPPVFAPPVFNPVFPVTPVVPVNPVTPVAFNPLVNPWVNPWAVNPWPVAPWQAVNPWVANTAVSTYVAPPVAFQQPGAFIPRNADTAVNPWSGAVLKPISGVAIQPDGSVFYRAPNSNLYVNPESGTTFNPVNNVLRRPATPVFLPWIY
jgi:hypothetical protein